jgi:hypothetical protein
MQLRPRRPEREMTVGSGSHRGQARDKRDFLTFPDTNGAGRKREFTVQDIKDALNASTDNVTEAAILLGCSRETVYDYLKRYPELQEYRRSIVATLNDFAESTVKQAIKARDWAATMKWLERRHPEWTKKQVIEHTGSLAVAAGVMSAAEIAALSDEQLQRLITVRKLEQDDVRSQIDRIEAAGRPADGDSDAT